MLHVLFPVLQDSITSHIHGGKAVLCIYGSVTS